MRLAGSSSAQIGVGTIGNNGSPDDMEDDADMSIDYDSVHPADMGTDTGMKSWDLYRKWQPTCRSHSSRGVDIPPRLFSHPGRRE